MTDKITIEVTDLSRVSDGYHTMQELYDHRCLLWICLCLRSPDYCYLKLDHYEGWFLLGMYKHYGIQISYHCPNKYLDLVKNKIKVDNNVTWDEHKPNDVLIRLENLAKELS